MIYEFKKEPDNPHPEMSSKTISDEVEQDLYGSAKGVDRHGRMMPLDKKKVAKQTSPENYWMMNKRKLQIIMLICCLLLFILIIGVTFG